MTVEFKNIFEGAPATIHKRKDVVVPRVGEIVRFASEPLVFEVAKVMWLYNSETLVTVWLRDLTAEVEAKMFAKWPEPHEQP